MIPITARSSTRVNACAGRRGGKRRLTKNTNTP
jgi:hypothetical protein